MRGMDRGAVLRRGAILLLALCLATLPVLPALAAPAQDEAPAWGRQMVDTVIGFVAGLVGIATPSEPTVIDLGGGAEATTTTPDPPPPDGGEGGPDWDPNG